jgi:hypothetical protein
MCTECDQAVHMGSQEGGCCESPVVRQTLSHRRCVWTGCWEPLRRECLVKVVDNQAVVQPCKLCIWPDIPCRTCGELNWRRSFGAPEPELLCFTTGGVVVFVACKFTCAAFSVASLGPAECCGMLDQACPADRNAGFFASFTGKTSSPVVWADYNLMCSLLCLVRCHRSLLVRCGAGVVSAISQEGYAFIRRAVQ